MKKYLIFTLNETQYGIVLSSAKEVCALTQLGNIPFTPKYVEGVMNLRGNMVIAINISKRLGIKRTNVDTLRPCIIVLKNEDQNLGWIVDSVDQVKNIEDIEICNEVKDQNKYPYVTGTIEFNNNFIFILNEQRLINETKVHLKEKGIAA